MPDHPPPFDYSALEDLERDLDRASVETLIRGYLAELDGRVTKLLAAADTANQTDLYGAAHTLKSTTALFGASELAGLCALIEAEARQNEQSPTVTIAAYGALSNVQSEAGRVRSALEYWISR